MSQEIKFKSELFHGVNSYVQLIFRDEGTDSVVDVGYVNKVELNKFIDTITETYIGMYGEPSFNAPSKVEYFGFFKKVLSDDILARGGRDETAENDKDGYLTNSILNFKDGEVLGEGKLLTFNIRVYTLTNRQKMITSADGCVITSFKRVMGNDSFFTDEFSFKFKRFKQTIEAR